MKKLFLLIAGLLFLLQSCGFTKHEKSFETAHGYMSQRGVSFIGGGNSALEIAEAEKRLAEADIYKSQAQINYAYAEKIKKNESGFSNNAVTGVIINDDLKKTASFKHPFLNQEIKVLPGGFEFIDCPQIPETVLIKFPDMATFSERRFRKKNTFYNGRPINFGIRVRSS